MIFHSYVSLPEGIRYNVNPGLINIVYGCLIGGDIIKKYHCDYLEGTPTINKPWFINPELTLSEILASPFGTMFFPVLHYI